MKLAYWMYAGPAHIGGGVCDAMCDRARFTGAGASNYTDWPAGSKGNCALIVIESGENFFSANISAA